MPAAIQRASLESGLLEAGARRVVRKRSARVDIVAPERPDRAAEAGLRQAMLAQAGTAFCKKGAASAASFKPWYWTYEAGAGEVRQTAPEIETPPPTELPWALAERGSPMFPFEVPPVPPAPEVKVGEILLPEPVAPAVEDTAVVEARRLRTAFAEQIAAMIENILATHDFAAMTAQRPNYAREARLSLAGPAGLLAEPAISITPDSLLAELAQARPEPRVAERPLRSGLQRFLFGNAR